MRARQVFPLILFLALLPPDSRAQGDELILWEASHIPLGIENIGTTLIGHSEGQSLFVTQGYFVEDGARYPALECRDKTGLLHWMVKGATAGEQFGEHLQWITLPGGEDCILWTYFPNPEGGEGVSNRGGLFRVSDGKQVHRFPKGSNNASLAADLDRDGGLDLLYSGQRFIQRVDLQTFSPSWEHTDRIFFCWGYPTIFKPGLGREPLIAWGSEYNLEGGLTSSLKAIDSRGLEVWKVDGIDEDLGSTPLFAADVNSDGTPELVKNGLDLEGRNRLPQNHLFVFSTTGELIRKIPSMMYSCGLADLDNDGNLEAFGAVCHRDGGILSRSKSELRCVDLATGKLEWTVPVPKTGLPAANALAADVDGDGQLEALISDGNPTFYGHLPGEDWGALYVVKADGTLIQTLTAPKWIRKLAMCDEDGDGTNELLMQLETSPAQLFLFETLAPATTPDWKLPFGNLQHWGAEHLRILP